MKINIGHRSKLKKLNYFESAILVLKYFWSGIILTKEVDSNGKDHGMADILFDDIVQHQFN